MDDNTYIKLIIIGIIGVAIFLIILFINPIGNFFKNILEWFIRLFMRKDTFDPITVWDWVITIVVIVFGIIYSIFRGTRD
ncbi:MAG: hypothetical protein HWN67_10930 [Candidatus Helarchaeota archaeon]|nr:hypothetical protein [Candidatus Helarchaeota archaeon]